MSRDVCACSRENLSARLRSSPPTPQNGFTPLGIKANKWYWIINVWILFSCKSILFVLSFPYSLASSPYFFSSGFRELRSFLHPHPLAASWWYPREASSWHQEQWGRVGIQGGGGEGANGGSSKFAFSLLYIYAMCFMRLEVVVPPSSLAPLPHNVNIEEIIWEYKKKVCRNADLSWRNWSLVSVIKQCNKILAKNIGS